MASICRGRNGRRRISFATQDHRRHTLRLGKCSQRDAETIRAHVEAILTAKALGLAPPAPTVAWIAATGPVLRSRLERCALAEPAGSLRLEDAAKNAFAGRKIKYNTIISYQQAVKAMLAHFTADRDIRSITAHDAIKFRDALRQEDLSEATVRRRCGVARDIFACAIKARQLTENPFAGLPTGAGGNPATAHLVTLEETQKLLDACPDAQWRLLVSLARFGGARVPSEPLSITWAHVDYEKSRLTVPSPKTAHHPGGGSRVIPLFPELRQAFDEALSAAGDPAATDFVITRYRQASCNLRTHLARIASRAGLKLWPKPWANMRASRDAELRRHYPAHIVQKWIGHSERIARAHYLLAPEEDYGDAAAANKTPRASGSASPEKTKPPK